MTIDSFLFEKRKPWFEKIQSTLRTRFSLFYCFISFVFILCLIIFASIHQYSFLSRDEVTFLEKKIFDLQDENSNLIKTVINQIYYIQLPPSPAPTTLSKKQGVVLRDVRFKKVYEKGFFTHSR